MSSFVVKWSDVISASLVLTLAGAAFHVWHRFDWGHPIYKLGCFVTMIGLATFPSRYRYDTGTNGRKLPIEAACYLVILLFIVSYFGNKYAHGFTSPPAVDIGRTTVAAAKMLAINFENPYTSHFINVRPELAEIHRGFHYGPLMLLGYLPSVYFPKYGFKAASIAYGLITLLLVWLLLWNDRKRQAKTLDFRLEMLFATALFFLPERFWFDIFFQGANDIFPVMLSLASLFFLADFCQHEQYGKSGTINKKRRVDGSLLLAGLAAGLSFSAKFSPAVFLVILLIRERLYLRFFIGFFTGLLPLFLFAYWDPAGLFQNVFRLRFILNYDATGLYSVTPVYLHLIYPTVLGTTVTLLLWRNFRKPLEMHALLVDFLVVISVAEVTFKEIHTNHLIWFFPIYAILVTENRYCLSPLLRRTCNA